jgi:hypothetical protein
MAKYSVIISEEVFYWLSAALTLFIAMEIIWPNIILAYFNLNWLLALWSISAVVLLIKK